MKHIRLFEELESQYKVGDYVLIKYIPKSKSLLELMKFVNNSIGKMMFIDERSVILEYVDIPDNIKHYFNDKNVGNKKIKNSAFFWYHNSIINRLATEDEIKEFKVKKDLNKFNL